MRNYEQLPNNMDPESLRVTIFLQSNHPTVFLILNMSRVLNCEHKHIPRINLGILRFQRIIFLLRYITGNPNHYLPLINNILYLARITNLTSDSKNNSITIISESEILKIKKGSYRINTYMLNCTNMQSILGLGHRTGWIWAGDSRQRGSKLLF